MEVTDALGLYRGQLPWPGGRSGSAWPLRGVEGGHRAAVAEGLRAWIAVAAWVERLSGRRPVREPAPYRPDGAVCFLGNMRCPPNENAAL